MVTENGLFLLIFQLLIKCNMEPVFVIKVTELVNSMIRYSFEGFHCIHFIRDSNTEFSILKDTLMQIQIPIVMWVLFETNYYEIKNDAHRCNGYIVVTQSTDAIKYLFEEINNSSIIKPHKRTFIFFHEQENLRNSLLEYAAFIRGIDIITVEGIRDNLSVGYNFLFDSAKLDKRHLQITSLRNNKTLISWNCTSNLQFNQEIFKIIPWGPKFEYNSVIYKLKMSTFNYRPYIVCDPENGVTDGIEYMLLKDLIKNWDVEFNILTETLPGYNQWKTTIAEVTNKSSSIALGAHWLYPIEGVDTDMSVPYGRSCATFLVPKSKRLSPSVFVFQALNSTLWLSLIAASITVAATLHVIAICYKKIGMGMGEHPYTDITLTVLDIISSCTTNSMLYLHSAFTRIHLRILLLILCFHSLLFTTLYSTGYASLLTYAQFSRPIRTFEDMITNKIHWECKNDYYDIALRDSIFVTFNQLADLQDFNKSLKTLNDRIRNDNIAIAVDTVDYGYIAETEAFDDYAKRNLKLLNGCFLDRYIMMRIIKDSPFTKLINKHITRIFETGLVQHWDMEMRNRQGERYLSNFYTELVTELIPRSPLTMENMQGGFYLLFFGYCLSILSFFIEKWKIFNRTIA